MKKLIVLIATILGFSSALTTNSCPTATTTEDFNLNAFAQGEWHMYARYPNEYATNNETFAFKGRHTRGNLYKFKATNVPETSPGYIEMEIEKPETADMKLKLIHGSPKMTTILHPKFLIYDNENYAIMYACEYDENEKVSREYAWIALRSTKPESGVKEAIEEYVKTSQTVKFDKFEWLSLTKETGRNRKRKN